MAWQLAVIVLGIAMGVAATLFLGAHLLCQKSKCGCAEKEELPTTNNRISESHPRIEVYFAEIDASDNHTILMPITRTERPRSWEAQGTKAMAM